MQKLISLWKNKSKNGNEYYTGKLGELNIIAFKNKKTNEKQPDLILYVKEKQQQQEKQDVFSEFGDIVSVDDDMLD